MRVTRTGKAINTGTDTDRRYRDIGSRRHAQITDQRPDATSRRKTNRNRIHADGRVSGTKTTQDHEPHHIDQSPPDNTFRCNSAFLAHLIGIKENAAHLRDHFRIPPEEGISNYLATAKSPRTIGQGRIVHYQA